MSDTLLESTELTETPDDQDTLPELYEVIDDEVREIEPMSGYGVSLASMLSHLMNSVAVPNKHGIVVTEMLFVLRESPRLQRRPDVAFVARSKRPADGWPLPNAWPLIPDIAVEFVSPNDRAEELEEKIGQYFTAGVRLVWVVYPQTERIHVFNPDSSGRVCGPEETIDAGDVLPGFTFRFRDLTMMLNGEET